MRFTLEIEPQHRPFWLHLTGSEGVKDFLRMAFEGVDLIDARVLSEAGFHTSDRRHANTVRAALVPISEINAQFAASASRHQPLDCRGQSGRTRVAWVPAENTAKQSHPSSRSKPSAIWLRAALCVHRKCTRCEVSAATPAQPTLTPCS
jgi:hypothetical protein